MQERRCVIVAGQPRSGTSWLAKSLAFARDSEDIDACRRFVEPFGLPYYPGFEPSVGSFAGDRPE